MPTEIQKCCELIEEVYEFTLSYAAQGHASDEGHGAGEQLRVYLEKAAEALGSLEQGSSADLKSESLEPAERFQAYFDLMARDAANARIAIELVLAQPAISSQMIDNLNASIHLRTLLTDLFLVTEILEARQTVASEE